MAGTSAINIQQKILILDRGSRKLIDGVIREDDILELNVTSPSAGLPLSMFVHAEPGLDIENIEDQRSMNKEMDAVYLLSPLPHIIDCVMADLERRRYRRNFLIWTSGLVPPFLAWAPSIYQKAANRGVSQFCRLTYNIG
ncbi:MAG: hypothetical protein Q9225_000179 [Loekoesia sp. 1 TL-2023]